MPESPIDTGGRIAMLIDGDNAEPGLLSEMIAETGKHGLVTIRRIFGDWTEPTMKGWKEVLHVHAIQPIQQFRNTVGKNATDSAMIIDAMDILYDDAVSGFCLVSSDSDYTRLATRIREKGFFVMGIGRNNTPKAFINACQTFVFSENLRSEAAVHLVNEQPTPKIRAGETQEKLERLLRKAIEDSEQDDGWAFLGVVGNRLGQLDSSFDVRTYGFRQLSQLFKSFPDYFEMRTKGNAKGPSQIYVKSK